MRYTTHDETQTNTNYDYNNQDHKIDRRPIDIYIGEKEIDNIDVDRKDAHGHVHTQ